MRHAVSKAARTEVHADPDAVCFVGEYIDVVVARADGAELLARLGPQPVALVAVGDRLPRRILKQWITLWRIPRAVLQTHTKRERALNFVGQLAHAALDLRQHQIGADRGVAAGDVEAHADDGDLVAICRDAADRHDVAEVAVGHEGRPFGAAGHVLEL